MLFQYLSVLDSGVIFKSPTGETGTVWLWQLEPTGCPRYEYEGDGRLVLAGDTVTRCVGNWVIAGLGNLGYDVSTINALKPLADTMAHTLAVAVFFCEDRGRAVHPKLHTGLLQVLPDHPTQTRNVAL
ncbi:hypothetical protein GEV33_001713 [Tenebrio molitor]|uniref:Uncharacterized protein n=1 Tax=Tenebrio molitor TaxID=7067 RepID=A0A8J6LJB4_TENMO|nr:hypothetical protein GEV33_001713 [Tenebrio molitor]